MAASLTPLSPTPVEPGEGGACARFSILPGPSAVRGIGRDRKPPRSRARRMRLIGMGALAVLVLGGCATSPEEARVRGEPGADPGNHGNPVVLMEPADQVERVYYEIPYDGPRVPIDGSLEPIADTSES